MSTTTSENVFDALANFSSKASKKISKADVVEEQLLPLAALGSSHQPEPESALDESSWTVQSSAKRRLTPQYSLSKNDLGVDSTKNRIQSDLTRKKGDHGVLNVISLVFQSSGTPRKRLLP
jgi:hypothetical protein